MRRFSRLVCSFLLIAAAAWSQAPVKVSFTANLQTLSGGTVLARTKFRLQLAGCGAGNLPRVMAGPLTHWMGPWNSATLYQAATYDAVQYGGGSYIAIADSLNQAPPNPTYWQPLGAGVIADARPIDFTPDVNGVATGAVWGNPDIACGANLGFTRYSVSVVRDGARLWPQSGPAQYFLVQGPHTSADPYNFNVEPPDTVWIKDPTITVESTVTEAPGTTASVVNDGTPSAARLIFHIPQGAQGIPGAEWWNGGGAPSNATGNDRDYYLNTLNGDVYAKANGAWSLIANIRGAAGIQGLAGAVWYNGAGTPSGSTGADGDYYLDTASGNVYRKSSGAWSLIGNIRGPQGLQGIQGPQGIAGDNSGGIAVTDPSPASGEVFLVLDRPTGLTITRVWCSVANGSASAVIDVKQSTESAMATLGASILSAPVTCSSAGSTGTVATSSISAHTPLMLSVGAIAGTPSSLYVQVEYVKQ